MAATRRTAGAQRQRACTKWKYTRTVMGAARLCASWSMRGCRTLCTAIRVVWFTDGVPQRRIVTCSTVASCAAAATLCCEAAGLAAGLRPTVGCFDVAFGFTGRMGDL